MPVPSAVLWAADPHTVAKHRLLENYLATWLPTMLQGRSCRVTYAEGFAGPGIYTDGEPGSPVIALRTFLGQHNLLAAGRSVDMVLAEEHARRLAELHRQLDHALAEASVPSTGINIEYVHGDHAAVLLPALKRIGAMRRPVFAFLDSYGGPDVPLDLARRIGAAPSSEVLVTFGTSFFIRFCEVEGHQADGDRVFGSRQWRQVAILPPEQKKPFLVGTYRESLRRAGFTSVPRSARPRPRSAGLHSQPRLRPASPIPADRARAPTSESRSAEGLRPLRDRLPSAARAASPSEPAAARPRAA